MNPTCFATGCFQEAIPGSVWCIVHANAQPPHRPPVRHSNSERFHTILKELGDLHDKKSADYGREDDPIANVRASVEWGVPAWVGAMIRATDKVFRLQTFARKGALSNESMQDSLRDLASYAIIALVLWEEVGEEIK